MGYTTTAKNTMLDALTPDTVSMHTADPGTNGANEVTGGGYARAAATFTAAANGARALTANVDLAGPASTATPFWGLWAGSTFLGGGPTTGDAGFNAAGAVRLTTGTTFDLNL